MNRRSVLKGMAACGAASASGPLAQAQTSSGGDITAEKIPHWRGFNLLGRFSSEASASGHAYEEFDFATMAEWGFNFVRLPVSYWVWSSPTDWWKITEAPLAEVDRAIGLGRQHDIHVNLNLHRIPGYCINQRELEPADLFTGTRLQRDRALAAAAYHWRMLSMRYKDIPNSRLSFDLINEPPKMRSYEGYLEERYVEIVRVLVEAIREVDPNRLIFADGMDIGQQPVMGIVDLGLVQSTRGYEPKAVTHYKAGWVPQEEFETFDPPTWPLKDNKGGVWDRVRLKAEFIDRYKPLTEKGVQVHVGEWGCYNATPHSVALAWMEDCLSLWHQAGWGFSLWNLRGEFGVLDSGRADVRYEAFRGHQLDRKMLDLIKGY